MGFHWQKVIVCFTCAEISTDIYKDASSHIIFWKTVLLGPEYTLFIVKGRLWWPAQKRFYDRNWNCEIFFSFIFFHLLTVAITRCLIFPLICSIVAHSHPNQDMGHLMRTENKSWIPT